MNFYHEEVCFGGGANPTSPVREGGRSGFRCSGPQLLPWQPFAMNVSRNGKVKKLAYLAGTGLILLKFDTGGYLRILNPKPATKFS